MSRSIFYSFLLLCFSAILLSAQERIQVRPSGTMTWEQMLKIEAEQASLPKTQRAIHEPMPGPGPREIGSPASGEGDHGHGTVPSQLNRTPFRELPTTHLAIPTLSFDAILDNNTSIPPDTYGSVGPSHIVTMLNTQVRIQSKTGGIISTVSLATFWTSIAGSKFDPKVNYDAGSGRWLAVCDADAALATSKVCFAISATSDPTGSWTFFEFDADASDATWADYPGFGHNGTWIAITHNMFTLAGSFVGEKMWVIDKSTAVAGGPLTTTVFPTGFDLSGGVSGFTLQPCVTFGTEPTLYIVDNSGWLASGTFLLRISKITGTGPAPAWSVQPGSPFAGTGLFFVANNFFFTQSDAPQSGLATLVETNDPRMLNAVFRNSRIWCTHSAALPVGGSSTRTAAFWYQLDPTAMPSPIVQSGVLDGGAGIHHYFPSISANSSDAACIGFSRSDGTKFVEAVYAGRLSADPLGTMPFGPFVFKLGESSYSKFFGGSRNRWGDYSNVCVDPADDVTFWTIQEYAGTNVGGGVDDGRWGTRWAKVVPPTDLPIQLSSFTGTSLANGNVRLAWTTISEINNYGFEVQKSTAQGGPYATIEGSFIPGHGTTNQRHTYTYVDTNALFPARFYRLKQIDLDGTIHYTEAIYVAPGTTGVATTVYPEEFSLFQNYPNPFNPTTVVKYALPKAAQVRLEAFNPLGQRVALLVDEIKGAGYYDAHFKGDALASGVYFYRIEARPLDGSQTYSSMKKMILVK